MAKYEGTKRDVAEDRRGAKKLGVSLNALGDGYNGTPPDARTLAIERAVHDIERELARSLIRFSAVERIAIERVLEQLADDVPNRRF